MESWHTLVSGYLCIFVKQLKPKQQHNNTISRDQPGLTNQNPDFGSEASADFDRLGIPSLLILIQFL